MDLLLPYIACLTLALTIYAALRPAPPTVQVAMVVIGVAATGWLLGIITGSLASFGEVSHGVFFVLFSLCAVAAAIRMITHERPIYSALHFVLVVIATAGLLLMLEAEFMAFALIIVYAGAILITYMFVLMLANQAENPDEPYTQAIYDRVPREPAAAVAIGFLLLCLISGTVIGGTPDLQTNANSQSQWIVLEELPVQFKTNVKILSPDFAWPPITENETMIQFGMDGAFIVSQDGEVLQLDTSVLPTNTQMVGWSLVNDFPVTIELAGVILLMAMFGAAVLARRAIELTEREKRIAILGEDTEEAGGDA
jgi:NADH-quinone oxidoreductase subunit J